jgi:hypothetical protein
MADVIFVAVIVAFFAVAVAYVKGCERIVGADTGTATDAADTDADEAGALASVLRSGR